MDRRHFLIGTGLSPFLFSGCSSRTKVASQPEDTGLNALVAYWEAGIPQWLGESKMPAASIAVIRNGQIAWKRAFGVKDSGTNEPVDNDTLFAACSNTKPLFAYGVLKLAEKAVLNLDTPLTKYTKRRVTKDKRIELVTARHVLTHTTGFPNWRQGPDLPIEFEPGSKNQYSGEGFRYLQSVVEEITGQPFEGFMRDNLLTPMGMTSSRISSDLDYAKVAKPHDEGGKRIAGKYYTQPTPAERAEGIANYGAAAMLMTTPTEYANFLLEILNPKPADDFRLNEASRAEMLRPQVKTAQHWEGLSWPIEQHPGAPAIFAHSGQDAGYYCIAAGCLERRSGFKIMMNGDSFIPFLMKLLGEPSGQPPTPATLWPGFVKRFFGA